MIPRAVPYFSEVKYMTYYFVALQTRSQAFILERRLKQEDVKCELTYMPREIMKDLCNMGVKFEESELRRASDIIRRSGLPGCQVYRETVEPNRCFYTLVDL